MAHFGTNYLSDIWSTFFFNQLAKHRRMLAEAEGAPVHYPGMVLATPLAPESRWDAIAVMEEMGELAPGYRERWGASYFIDLPVTQDKEPGTADSQRDEKIPSDSVKRNFFALEVAKMSRYAIPDVVVLEQVVSQNAASQRKSQLQADDIGRSTGMFDPNQPQFSRTPKISFFD